MIYYEHNSPMAQKSDPGPISDMCFGTKSQLDGDFKFVVLPLHLRAVCLTIIHQPLSMPLSGEYLIVHSTKVINNGRSD